MLNDSTVVQRTVENMQRKHPMQKTKTVMLLHCDGKHIGFSSVPVAISSYPAGVGENTATGAGEHWTQKLEIRGMLLPATLLIEHLRQLC